VGVGQVLDPQRPQQGPKVLDTDGQRPQHGQRVVGHGLVVPGLPRGVEELLDDLRSTRDTSHDHTFGPIASKRRPTEILWCRWAANNCVKGDI